SLTCFFAVPPALPAFHWGVLQIQATLLGVRHGAGFDKGVHVHSLPLSIPFVLFQVLGFEPFQDDSASFRLGSRIGSPQG
ncbi:MAG: hypothetical protein V4710_14945, partial [Verrucomicrobiota bacterium]